MCARISIRQRSSSRLSALPSETHQKKRKTGFDKGLIPYSALEALLDPALDERISVADPLARMASLNGPVANIERMLAEIDGGRS